MTGCPAWCVGDHDGERRHLAEIQGVYPAPSDGDAPYAVFVDLRQDPREDRPTVYVHLDEMPVMQLPPADAVDLGWALLELGLMGRER
ncbi:hypothetical protein ACU635_50485 [[Actinomadura] parvosata]|uniref:hypothetical protein n=1 Tax=[Actinomadura] parvosata TaxID=1955412 RepID=UPI00406CAE7B